MKDETSHTAADALRAEFDSAFRVPARRPPDVVPLLAIRIATAPFAVRLLEAGGLITPRQIVPVPSGRPELLGITGLRGEVLPVYSLARLVLHVDDPEPPRWIILAGSVHERIGLAFGGFDGHVIAATGDLHAPIPGERLSEHTAEMHAGPPPRPVLSMPALVAALTAR